MFTIDRSFKSDTLVIVLKVTGEVLSHCQVLDKDFIVKQLVVNFEDGNLISVKATGPVRKKDGGAHARLDGERYILGARFKHDPASTDDLPDWASDLPEALATDPTYLAYINR